MTAIKDILNVGLAAQAANLAMSNVKKKKKTKIVGQAVNNIIGTMLIKEQADFIGVI